MRALLLVFLGGAPVGATTAAAVLKPAAGRKPHIIMHLADDFGWANAGWHRPVGYKEVQTPSMNALVKEGIELDHAYSFKFCSPTRSSLQSGRLPVHVNMLNLGPETWNPADPVSGFAAIPRNMTGIAAKLKSAGYKTHQVGKWDAGMGTVDHTPHGRGYDTSFGYFHHDNDYWTEHVGAFVDLYNETETTSWAGPPPSFAPTDGAAYGLNGSCSQDPAWGPGATHCGMVGPEEVYEEYKFKLRVLEIIRDHDAATAPLFLCYTSHIVHEPLQVPNATWHKFDMIGASAVGDFDHHRQTYHAMVNYMDGVVGAMVSALQEKEMWADTLWVHQSDNGGPSFSGSSHTANNYPLKGSKMTNWQGGIRVNAFVSGGLLKTAAPAKIGTKVDGLTHVCDWYATFCALAGVNKTDERGAKANLPPVDGLNLWPYLSGSAQHSPRTEVFADPKVLVMEVDGKKWKLFGTPGEGGSVQAGETAGSNDQVQTLPSGRQVWIGHQLPDDRRRRELQFANCSAGIPGFCLAHAGKQHILKEMPCESNATCQAECCSQCIANEQCVVWTVNTKLDKCFLRDAAGPRNEGAECTSGLVRSWTPPPPAPPRTPGPVSVNTACWMGPQYPNGTVSPACNSTMHCPTGCLFDLETDPGEHTNVAAANPAILMKLVTRLNELYPTVFNPQRAGGDKDKAANTARARGGYWGPFVFP